MKSLLNPRCSIPDIEFFHSPSIHPKSVVSCHHQFKDPQSPHRFARYITWERSMSLVQNNIFLFHFHLYLSSTFSFQVIQYRASRFKPGATFVTLVSPRLTSPPPSTTKRMDSRSVHIHSYIGQPTRTTQPVETVQVVDFIEHAGTARLRQFHRHFPLNRKVAPATQQTRRQRQPIIWPAARQGRRCCWRHKWTNVSMPFLHQPGTVACGPFRCADQKNGAGTAEPACHTHRWRGLALRNRL